MTAAKEYPPITCSKHPSYFLLDTIERDGAISHLCNVCQHLAGDDLVMVDVVRQLHRRKSEMVAEKKGTGS